MIKNILYLVGKGLLLLALTTTTSFGQRIFPGAEGFGVDSRGAYGGTVEPRILIVDNLSGEEFGDEVTGRGTLRWAATRSYPRVIVFEVSGTIDLNVMDSRRIYIENPYISIYGQTAPSPGITMRAGNFSIRTHDVLIQHIRTRNGNERSEDVDCMGMTGGNVYNVIIDHCSFSWANDELLGLNLYAQGHDITVSNCVFGESFVQDPDHSKYPSLRGMGMTVILASRVSITKNLFIHVNQRIPFVNSDRDVFVTNNIIYNSPHGNKVYIKGENMASNWPGETMQVSVIGNIKKTGPSGSSYNLVNLSADLPIGSKVYMQDNVCAGITDQAGMVANFGGPEFLGTTMVVEPDIYSYVHTDDLEDHLVLHSGARPTDRDPVDVRLINDLRNLTGGLIDGQEEVGGWPNLTENHITLDIPSNPHADDNGNGYTNLEDWVASLSEADYVSASFDVRNSADSSPIYEASVSVTDNGTSTTNSTGLVTFSSLNDGDTYDYTISKMGFEQASGSFTVTDGMNINIELDEIVDNEAPTAASGLSGSSSAPDQIDLSWSGATDNVGVAGYNVLRNGVQLGQTSNLHYADESVSASTSYSYIVRSFDAAGNLGPASNSESVTSLDAPDTEAPTTPTALSGDAISETELELSWNISTDNVAVRGYNIFRDNVYQGHVEDGSMEWIDSDLNPGTSYQYEVTAYDAAWNESARSTSITLTTLASEEDTEAPIVPTGFEGTALSPTVVELKWNMTTDNVGVLGYNIFRDDVYQGHIEDGSMEWIDSELSAETSYEYELSAYDAVWNESARSAPITITTLAPTGDTDAPSIPVNLHASEIEADYVTLEWSASTDASGVVGYNFFRDGDLIAVVSGTSYTDTELLPGTAYEYTISSWDESGNESNKCTPLEVQTSELENVIFVNPESTSFATPTGSIGAPYTSWSSIDWQEGFTYLQMRGTSEEVPKILIDVNNIKIGAYGEGDDPVLISTATDYAISVYDKKNIVIRNLDIKADLAIGAIYFTGDCDSNIVEHCSIEGSDYGIRLTGGKNFVIQYNEVEAELNGIFTMAENTRLYYNEITNCVTGIQVNSYNSVVKVFNNVFYDNMQAISSSYGELELYNNIFSLEQPGSMAITSEMDEIISDYNIFYPERGNFIEIAGYSYHDLQSYKDLTGNATSSKAMDPKFENPFNEDFTLGNTSPAINAGRDVGLISDKAGSQVPIGPSPDIGVMETAILTKLVNPFGEQSGIQIYPSPNNGNFKVSFDLPQEDDLEICIYEQSGKLVTSTKARTSDPVEFHLNSLPNASYFLKVNSSNKIYTQKFQIIQ